MLHCPPGMRTPDTSHLCAEDAELLTALYIERNGVSRGELARLRWDVRWTREEGRIRVEP